MNRGDASALTILLDAAMSDPKLATIAREGLIHLPGRDVDTAVFDRLARADAKGKVIVLDLIGARQIVSALPAVREALASADRPVRLAALVALAQLVDVAQLDLLIDKALIVDGDKDEIAAAKVALQNATQRNGRPRRLRREAGRPAQGRQKREPVVSVRVAR